MEDEKRVKPNVAFLRKVEAGHVRLVAGYKARTGGYRKFYGGEATAKKHMAAGFIAMKGVPSLGRSVVAELTDAGRRALTAEASKNGEGR